MAEKTDYDYKFCPLDGAADYIPGDEPGVFLRVCGSGCAWWDEKHEKCGVLSALERL